MLDALSEAQLDQAVEKLRELYLAPAALSDKELRRARLRGLLERLGPGAELVEAAAVRESAPVHPFLAEILDGRMAYVRLGKLDESDLAQLDAVIEGFEDNPVEAVILDLRGVVYSADFETAAEFAKRFCAKGKLLFRIHKPSAKQERIFTSNQQPEYEGMLVVLTDGETAGAAEALAAALRLHAGAMVVGGTSAGQAVEFHELPVGAGVALRAAVAEVILPGEGSLFPAGVKPDIAVSQPVALREEVFRLSRERGVSHFVFEKERPRFNEAALIANMNPEIDGAPSGEDVENGEQQMRDVVLQRAVDLVTAISFFSERP